MRTTKNEKVNLNTLSKGCSPCLAEAKKIERQISDRKISDIKIEEIKMLVSSLFKKNKKK